MAFWRWFFPFPVWWDMLIPWRVTILGWIFNCKIVNEKILLVVQLGNVERFDEELEWHQWRIFDFEDGNHCDSPCIYFFYEYTIHSKNVNVEVTNSMNKMNMLCISMLRIPLSCALTKDFWGVRRVRLIKPHWYCQRQEWVVGFTLRTLVQK